MSSSKLNVIRTWISRSVHAHVLSPSLPLLPLLLFPSFSPLTCFLFLHSHVSSPPYRRKTAPQNCQYDIILSTYRSEGKKKYPLPKRYIESCEAEVHGPKLDHISFSAHHYGSDWPRLGNMPTPGMSSKMSSIWTK